MHFSGVEKGGKADADIQMVGENSIVQLKVFQSGRKRMLEVERSLRKIRWVDMDSLFRIERIHHYTAYNRCAHGI